jgi:hypothetical protein
LKCVSTAVDIRMIQYKINVSKLLTVGLKIILRTG